MVVSTNKIHRYRLGNWSGARERAAPPPNVMVGFYDFEYCKLTE